jgi:hypothetical protein
MLHAKSKRSKTHTFQFRNFRNGKYPVKDFFLEIRWPLFYKMQIFEQKYDFIPERPALVGWLVKFRQLDKYLEFPFVGKLFCLQVEPTLFRKIKSAVIPFVIQNSNEKAAWQAVVFNPFVYAFGLYASEIKPDSASHGFKLDILHFQKVSVLFAVFAENVENHFLAFRSRPQKLGRDVSNALNWSRQNSGEKVIEQSHEQKLSVFSKYLFESPINKQRRKLYGHKLGAAALQRRLAFANNGLFKHNTSFMVKAKQEPKFNVNKEGCEALRNEDGNIENFKKGDLKCIWNF